MSKRPAKKTAPESTQEQTIHLHQPAPSEPQYTPSQKKSLADLLAKSNGKELRLRVVAIPITEVIALQAAFNTLGALLDGYGHASSPFEEALWEATSEILASVTVEDQE